jgi:uncharacterized protein YrrD
MIKAKDVVGLRIVSLKDGKELGTIEDILYDPSSQQVKALLLQKSGLFSEEKALILPNIYAIGKDAVTVNSADAIQSVSSLGDPISEMAKNDQYLDKTRVLTEDGTDLGKVTDIYFDQTTGAVTEFEVSQGLLKNAESGKKRVAISDIVTVGEEATIVKNYTEDHMEEQAKNQGVSGAVNKAKDQTPEMLDRAKAKAEDLAQAAKKKFEEVKNKPEMKQAADQFKQDMTDLKHKVKQGAESAKDKVLEVRRDQDPMHNVQGEVRVKETERDVTIVADGEPKDPGK